MKKTVSLVLAALMLTASVSAADFNDISGHWAETVINELSDKGIVSGFGDGSFMPNGVVTRINAGDISRQGRPATGVKIQNLQENDSVITVNKIVGQSTDDPIDKAIENAIDNAVEQTKLLDVEDKPEA